MNKDSSEYFGVGDRTEYSRQNNIHVKILKAGLAGSLVWELFVLNSV